METGLYFMTSFTTVRVIKTLAENVYRIPEERTVIFCFTYNCSGSPTLSPTWCIGKTVSTETRSVNMWQAGLDHITLLLILKSRMTTLGGLAWYFVDTKQGIGSDDVRTSKGICLSLYHSHIILFHYSNFSLSFSFCYCLMPTPKKIEVRNLTNKLQSLFFYYCFFQVKIRPRDL